MPASGTAIFLPLILLFKTSVLILEEDGAIKSSATASVPTISPLTSFGKISFLSSSLPYFMTASVNKYTEDENGTGARNLPNSSAITHNSR